mmetsp:Transcript_12360/g.27074  ORF Transcript_12360/g.27074 Transcript_12360/m.27074 type:complete len:278 (+) Transcript_12360:39-872(+)
MYQPACSWSMRQKEADARTLLQRPNAQSCIPITSSPVGSWEAGATPQRHRHYPPVCTWPLPQSSSPAPSSGSRGSGSKAPPRTSVGSAAEASPATASSPPATSPATWPLSPSAPPSPSGRQSLHAVRPPSPAKRRGPGWSRRRSRPKSPIRWRSCRARCTPAGTGPSVWEGGGVWGGPSRPEEQERLLPRSCRRSGTCGRRAASCSRGRAVCGRTSWLEREASWRSRRCRTGRRRCPGHRRRRHRLPGRAASPFHFRPSVGFFLPRWRTPPSLWRRW